MPSHGALSKAGKVRSTTPKVGGEERKSPCPRVCNRRRHYKRFTLGRNVGQYNSGYKRGRRRPRR